MGSILPWPSAELVWAPDSVALSQPQRQGKSLSRKSLGLQQEAAWTWGISSFPNTPGSRGGSSCRRGGSLRFLGRHSRRAGGHPVCLASGLQSAAVQGPSRQAGKAGVAVLGAEVPAFTTPKTALPVTKGLCQLHLKHLGCPWRTLPAWALAHHPTVTHLLFHLPGTAPTPLPSL